VHGQVHRELNCRQTVQAHHDTVGGNGEVPVRDAEVFVEAGHGRPDLVVVGQWFAHSHEHDVGDPAGTGGPDGVGDLFDDLTAAQMPEEAGLAGCAEPAAHRTAGLGGDTHRCQVGVVHEDGLDGRALGQG